MRIELSFLKRALWYVAAGLTGAALVALPAIPHTINRLMDRWAARQAEDLALNNNIDFNSDDYLKFKAIDHVEHTKLGAERTIDAFLYIPKTALAIFVAHAKLSDQALEMSLRRNDRPLVFKRVMGGDEKIYFCAQKVPLLGSYISQVFPSMAELEKHLQLTPKPIVPFSTTRDAEITLPGNQWVRKYRRNADKLPENKVIWPGK